MPSYGASTYKGHTISNAFFWVINRSQDATFLHDWFSKTGQAVAGEYRYVSLGGTGNVRTDFLDEHPTTFIDTDGTEVDQPGRRTSALRQPQPESRRLVVRAGTRGLLQRPGCRSALRLGHRARNAAHEELRGSVSGTTKGVRLTGTFDGTSTSPRTRLRRCADAPRVNVLGRIGSFRACLYTPR